MDPITLSALGLSFASFVHLVVRWRRGKTATSAALAELGATVMRTAVALVPGNRLAAFTCWGELVREALDQLGWGTATRTLDAAAVGALPVLFAHLADVADAAAARLARPPPPVPHDPRLSARTVSVDADGRHHIELTISPGVTKP